MAQFYSLDCFKPTSTTRTGRKSNKLVQHCPHELLTSLIFNSWQYL